MALTLFRQSHARARAVSFFQPTDPQCGSSISTQTTGSYRKVNPTLATLVTSLEEIVDTLQRAPPEWWKEGGGNDNNNVELSDHQIPLEEDDEDDDDDESIDLQKLAEEAEAAEANNTSMDSDED